MTRRGRWLRAGMLALVALHLLAFLLWLGQLRGVSHLAAWPRAVGRVWTAACGVLLFVLPNTGRGGGRREFPGRTGALVVAAVAMIVSGCCASVRTSSATAIC